MIRSKILALYLIIIFASMFSAYAAFAAETSQPADDPAMAAMMKAATPGEHHKPLGRLAGDWTYTMKLWMDPGQAPMETGGTMHGEWIMGGRYVRCVYKGEFMGEPFLGESTEGYDNVAGKYVGTWIDNAGTGIMFSDSTCDTGCMNVTSTGDMLDPMSGQKMTSKSVITWTGDKMFKMEMFMIDGSGSSMKTMEMIASKSSKE